MVRLESLGRVVETDVLVIGGGVSGLWAANKAKLFVDRVLIVEKGPRDWGGQCAGAGGDMDIVPPEENIDDWLEELVYYFDGLIDQNLVEEVLRQTYDRFKDYKRLGHEFVMGPDGKLKGIPQRGLKHVKMCIARPYGEGGIDKIRVLTKEANRLGVGRLGRTLVTDLLKHDGTIVGAVGFNAINGEFYTFKTRAVVLATGDPGWKISEHVSTATGEGIAMALRAGAELRNCEFVKVFNFPKLFEWEGQTGLLPLGARFVNAKGENFMNKYSPILGGDTDPAYNVRAMAIEAREGRGPFYMDCSAMKPEDVEIMKPGAGHMLLGYNKLLDIGIDFFGQKTEWMPRPYFSLAGVVSDTKCQTKVPGLFVAGRARSVEPAVYIGGWSLANCAVSGYIAGENAGRYANSIKSIQVDEGEVKTFKNHLYAPLGKVGIPPKEVLTAIQETVSPYDVCILKSETNLKKALHKIESIRDELLPQMTARDAHYLLKLIEVRAIHLTSELLLRASLMRTESRAGHYREDYPDRDENWLKWIIVSQKDGKLNLRTEPLPLDRYKFKPTRYYMDNFRFPKYRGEQE